MAHKLRSMLALFSLIGYGTIFAKECEWKVQYTGFPSEFKYYSTCNGNEYFSVKMVSLIEYTSEGPTTNRVIFELYGENWNWLWPGGKEISFHGFDCLMNKYVGKLNKLFPDRNCFVNVTTYLFEENAQIHIYNFTERIIDKYSLKWDFDIGDWPWLDTNDYLLLCMQFKTNSGGIVNRTEDRFWLNFTVAKYFEISIPKIWACHDTIKDNVGITVNDGEKLVDICVNIPYCNGAIYFDPVVHSTYIGTPPAHTMSGGEIAGIVIAVLIGIVLIIGLVYFCVSCCKKIRNPMYDGLLVS